MMRRALWAVCVSLTVMLAASCGPETPDAWNQPYELEGPVEAKGELIYLNQTLEQLHILEPGKSNGSVDLTVSTVSTGKKPTKMALSPSKESLYLVNSGDKSLSVYDLTSEDFSRSTVELDSAYDRITVDPAGEFVVLSFTGRSNSECIACNLNEIAILDLRKGVPDQAKHVTLPKRAQDIVFADEFNLDGSKQRLAAALSPSQISLIDLQALMADNKDDGVREVPLTVSQAEQIKQPKQAVFDVTPNSKSSNTISLYLLTVGGNDVTQVAIQPSARKESNLKFDLSVNQLAAGTNPSAMTILDLPEAGTRLLTLDSRRPQFHLVDVKSGEGSSFSLPLTSAASDLLVYNTVVSTTEGEKTETRVLAWSRNSPLVAVIRPASIAIADDNPTVGRSVEAIRLDSVPSSVRMDKSAERERALALHGQQSGGFSVLNLQATENNAISIQGAALGDIEFAGPVAWGVFSGKPNFGKFNLETGHPTTYPLPSAGDDIFFDSEDGLIAVDHGRPEGEFTVIDINKAKADETAKNARVFQGVFVQDLLQTEFPED